jgi:hypothetical protein
LDIGIPRPVQGKLRQTDFRPQSNQQTIKHENFDYQQQQCLTLSSFQGARWCISFLQSDPGPRPDPNLVRGPWTQPTKFSFWSFLLQLRTLDPIFAVSVGVAAAVVRINREEKEKGKSFEQSKESLGRRAGMAWKIVRGEIEGEKAGAGASTAKWKPSLPLLDSWRMKLKIREAPLGVEAPER